MDVTTVDQYGRIDDVSNHNTHSDYNTLDIDVDNILESDIPSCSICDVTPPASHDTRNRQQAFNWEKPPSKDYHDLSASAKLAVALTLEDDLRQRDLLIRLLSKQLKRSHEEKYKLLQELNSYRGSDRETLYQENGVLRQRIRRVTRENLALQAIHIQRQNSRLNTPSHAKTRKTQ